MAGWDSLRQLFIDNGLQELADVITQSIQNNGIDNANLVYEDLRKSDTYKTRFKGNFDRLASGKNMLSEGEYLQQENMYREVMTPYGAGALATRDNFAKFIGEDTVANPDLVATKYPLASAAFFFSCSAIILIFSGVS